MSSLFVDSKNNSRHVAAELPMELIQKHRKLFLELHCMQGSARVTPASPEEEEPTAYLVFMQGARTKFPKFLDSKNTSRHFAAELPIMIVQRHQGLFPELHCNI